MAQPFGSGAVHAFANIAGAITYVGTSEQMPQDQRNSEYELLMNDISGSKKPLDMAWEGTDATISMVLTRFNYAAINLLEAMPDPISNFNGQWSINDVGALMGLEDMAIQLWLVYAFGAAMGNKAAYVSQGMPPGRYYPQCVVWAPMADETGSRPMKKQLIFYAWPKLMANKATALPSLAASQAPFPINTTPQSFMLYSTNSTFFTGLPPIT